MNFKDGVWTKGIQPELVLGLVVVDDVFKDHGIPCTVTALRNGKHMEGSLHYAGLGADIRLPSRYTGEYAGVDAAVTGDIKSALGVEWDVILESDHIHVEFDPKTKEIA